MKVGQIGVVGLGVMGESMARNLLKRFPVMVFNRTRKRCESLRIEGAPVAGTVAELASECEAVCLSLSDDAAVSEIALGSGGLVENLSVGSLVIDFSTISPRTTRSLATAFQEKGIEFLDAPVSGGDVGARAGTLTIMVGGKESSFERALPVFQAVGKKIVRMGESGSGQMMKAINQVAVALSVTAMTEALILAGRSGLSVEMALDVLRSGAAGSWSFDNYAPRVLAEDFRPGFSAKHMHKDLVIALSEAAGLGLTLPGTEMTEQLFAELCSNAREELGNHALIKRYGAE